MELHCGPMEKLELTELKGSVTNMLWCIGVGFVFFALGIFIFLKPDLIWKITESWKSYSADEPSDLYVISTKFGGVLFTILGIIMVILPFVLE